jgi:hypothetical protein
MALPLDSIEVPYLLSEVDKGPFNVEIMLKKLPKDLIRQIFFWLVCDVTKISFDKNIYVQEKWVSYSHRYKVAYIGNPSRNLLFINLKREILLDTQYETARKTVKLLLSVIHKKKGSRYYLTKETNHVLKVIGHYEHPYNASSRSHSFRLDAEYVHSEDEDDTGYNSKYVGKDLLKALIYFYYPPDF